MKIALVQMDVAHGQPVENKKHVKEMLERALVANPDVIVYSLIIVPSVRLSPIMT